MPLTPDRSLGQLTEAFNRRQWPLAAQLSQALLPQQPRHPMLHFIAGVSLLELRQLPRALTHLQHAAQLAPERADFGLHFARALSEGQLHGEALAAAKSIHGRLHDDAPALDMLGVIYTRAGALDLALQALRRVNVLQPRQAHYRHNLGTTLIVAGELAQAEQEIQACLDLDPTYWRAHLTLAQLRRWTPEHNHVERIEALLAAPGADSPAASAQLHLALAKEYEDIGQFPRALAHLSQGKTLAFSGHDYVWTQDAQLFAAIERAEPARNLGAVGFLTDEPIFVIGMPRSGTTLVERILSSHPDVHSAGELPNFARLVKRASGSRTPKLIDTDTIEHAKGIDLQRLGEAYLASTRPATGRTRRFVDKLPHNFLYAGWIAQALPHARIVCLRRDPMDTCLSNFRQLLGADAPFFGYSFDLLDTGRYYVLFDRLMAHWQRLFPGRILEVAYESLVADQEAVSRQLLAWCGLTWNDACLDFSSNRAPVATASAVQVREPLYHTAIQRWKRYGDQLDGLRAELEAGGITIAG